ncbi:hypothetical protein GCM10010531_41870 [Blastococcus jejuensis]|uniref:Integral membrane protein n=1 Tax=Blastococcus jejuensis TaxID=351224 RepID=A0ABP6PM75_9ACTN
MSSRRAARLAAAAVCLGVGVLYAVLFFLVADAEAGASENTYGAYLLLAVPYLAGGVLLATVARRGLWVSTAVLQIVVLVLFVLFAVGGSRPGVFEYEALSGLHMAVWAAVITGAQVVLLGLLGYLIGTSARSSTSTPARPAG